MPVKAPVVPASEVAPSRAYDWNGLYLGAHAGYLWGRTHVEADGLVTEDHASTDGAIGGALAGYNLQSGPLVLGVEADFGLAHARGEGSAVSTTFTHASNSYLVNWTVHARGRVGLAADHWLIYVAGGPGVADLDFREGAVTTVTVGTKYVGWSAGGGVELAIARNLIGRLEYLYDDFGHRDYAGESGGTDRVALTGQTFRGALTWKFDAFDPER